MSDFYKLSLASVDPLTPNAVALTFAIPDSLKTIFSFEAGQYITLKHEVNGQEVRRASVYANDKIKKGDTLEVMPPDGRFVFKKNEGQKTVAAFAAGSGITPIMSIAQTVLEANDTNKFVLVYGNQKPEEAMYLSNLKALQSKYSERFFIEEIYSRTNVPDCLFGCFYYIKI